MRWPRANGLTLSIQGVLAVVTMLYGGTAFAVTCITQAQMTVSQRSELQQAALHLGQLVQKGDTATIKTGTLPKVASQFEGIASGIQSSSPLIQGAALTVDQIYSLDASDLKQPQDTQFFCGVGGTPLAVALNFQQLPPGQYAFVILHATGVVQPQQMAFILANDGGWKLAGFYVRPMLFAGHDGVWYWSQARDYAKKNQNWVAYFYYQTAQFLLIPVDFLGSPNLEKLQREQAAALPSGLPGAQPMVLTLNGQSWNINSLRTDASLGGLDLVIHYQAQAGGDPVVSRQRAIEVMKAMLAAHPELRPAFHGLWVYADTPDHAEYAVELPMAQIP
ncbi:MAG TPA: hypothetical protein VM554_15940 [Acidisarcina sp.]|nr:hypothetical protein [Acidisarcina sp.]